MIKFKNPLRFILFFLVIIISSKSFAQLSVSPVFSNNMVLQRNKPVVIWGKEKPGATVTVSFDTQKKSTVTDENGVWKIWLKPLQVSTINKELTISASTTLVFTNVLVGDVWLCSGQSNMEYPLDRVSKRYKAGTKGTDEGLIEMENKNRLPIIRYLYVERNLKKQPELPSTGWINGNDSTVKLVTAIGYFFAKEIAEKTGIPIGIISSSWGGTRIEPWIPDWAYQQSTVFKDSAQTPDFKIDGVHPGQMFNAMIKPMLPLAIKGILWYQGESDLTIHDHATYAAKFSLLTNTWRGLFNDKKIPMYYVQLAPHLYTKRKDLLAHTAQSLPEFWEVQTSSLSIKNTGMVVTTDLVPDLSDIHPPYKWIVAHRLVNLAMAKLYGEKQTEFSGPKYASMKINKGSIALSFTHATSGLSIKDATELSWFSIAGADGNFVPASAKIDGKKIIVSAPSLIAPTQVRFGWDETAQPNLFNNAGLPAIPFRTNQ